MKRILFRVAVLGAIATLGLIAIAQTQRSSSSADKGNEAGTAFVSDNTAGPAYLPAETGGNPLRGGNAAPANPSTNSSAPPSAPDLFPASDAGVRPLPGDATASDPPADEHPLRKMPATDPFAQLQGNAAASPVRPAAAQEPAVVTPDSQRGRSDPALDAGPMIVPPGNADRRAPTAAAANSSLGPPPGGDRYLTPGDNRYTPPPAATGEIQEPRRFQADPARAMPANAMAGSTMPGHATSGAATDQAQDSGPATGGTITYPYYTNHGPRDSFDRGGNSIDNAASPEGTGQPGGKHLEGPQSPQLTIEKVVPREVQVGKPATFRITVRNTGQAVADNVEVRDQIPRGTRLLDASPRAARGPNGEVTWTLGTIKPGEQSSVQLQLMPTAEGEIGSVATVHFDAGVSARTVATRPKLVVETTGADRVLAGNAVTLTIVVSNPGTGVASGVVLEEHIPAGLQHPAGSELEYNVGDLRPGESRRLELQMTAHRPARSPTCSPPARKATCGPRTASTSRCYRRSWTLR